LRPGGRSASESGAHRIFDRRGRLANPAYGILPLTGVIMVLVGELGFTTFWILAAIGPYVLVGVIAGVFFAPSLRRQTELVEREGTGSGAYEAAARRMRTTDLLTMVPSPGSST
jgi:hypothetical protein